jgi:hypothetical protein
MGWFGKNDVQNSTQFGAPQQQMGMQGMGMNNNMGMGMGMDPSMMGMQMAQNPMMQQMANDPITATARLLQLNDPVAQFITTPNIGLVMDLIGEIVRLSVKEFFTQVSFIQDEAGKITLDPTSLPPSLNTLSPENLGLTMNRLQSSAQQTISMNEQQRQMFMQAHSMGMNMNPQQQPGFFGSLLGGMMGNAVQNQGGFGQTMAKGATMGAAVL